MRQRALSEVILTFTDLYVENYARFLQESNLTLAETQVKFQETRDLDFNFLYVVLVLFGIFAAVLLLSCLPCFSRGIADYYSLLLKNWYILVNRFVGNPISFEIKRTKGVSLHDCKELYQFHHIQFINFFYQIDLIKSFLSNKFNQIN